MARQLRTGLRTLDRKLDGGLPAGSVVALSASPASQAELFLYRFAVARSTLYLTTERPAPAVRSGIERAGFPTEGIAVRETGRQTPLDAADRLLRAPPIDPEFVLIDAVDALERADAASYRAFLDTLQSYVARTETVAVLHCLDGRRVPERRDLTEYVADVILDLDTHADDDVETRLTVPKFRGGRALTDAIKLELAGDIRIDTSRDIA